jgi:hypothetical protein
VKKLSLACVADIDSRFELGGDDACGRPCHCIAQFDRIDALAPASPAVKLR